MSEHVFLSYARTDIGRAERLWRELTLWGVPVWKDDRGLRVGDKLDPEVKAAIEASRAFLLLGTPAALESEYVDKEIGWALEVEKQSGRTFQVIPVRAGAGEKTLERAFGRGDRRIYADATHDVVDAVPPGVKIVVASPWCRPAAATEGVRTYTAASAARKLFWRFSSWGLLGSGLLRLRGLWSWLGLGGMPTGC